MRALLTALLLAVTTAAGAQAADTRPFLPPPLPQTRALQSLAGSERLLLQIERTRRTEAFSILVRHGARLVSATLDIWAVPTRSIIGDLPRLERLGLLRAVEPVRRVARLRGVRPPLPFSLADPLVATEWWRATVRADAATPPGPGVPVTVIDSGLDLTHPEFAGRPDTVTLNEQATTGAEEEHGTAVSSVVAAPENGVGLAGVYPRTALWEWDVGGFTNEEEIAGLDAAMARGQSVINLSLGGNEPDFMEESAILTAFGTGSLVVASAGNEFQEGNPVEYPAGYNHVLTIAATNQRNEPSDFSNENLSIDLAAPGEGIPVAVPLTTDPSGYASYDGTSFSSPIVAGAAAWVWTARPSLDTTQIFDLLRFSARDIWDKGYDKDTGFGMLDIAAALSQAAPASDPQEPNEDVYLVKPDGLFADGSPLLTNVTRRRASLRARLDVAEDPSDVYRIWVPARTTVRLRMKPDDDAQLQVWRTATRSVFEKGAARKRDLIVASTRPGTATEVVSVANKGGTGAIAYTRVFLGPDALDAYYSLTIAPVSR